VNNYSAYVYIYIYIHIAKKTEGQKQFYPTNHRTWYKIIILWYKHKNEMEYLRALKKRIYDVKINI